MNFKKEYGYLIIAVVLIFVSVYFLFSRPLETRFVDVKIEVGDKVGIILNESEMDFGILPRGSTSLKKIDVGNDRDFPLKVDIFISKNLKDFVFSESEIIISEGKVSAIPFTAIIPVDMPKGNYSGEIKFEFYRAD